MMTASLRPDQRIRKRKDFDDLMKKGRRAKGLFLELRVLDRESAGRPMIAVMVSKKVNLRATARNLWKRRIREAFRKNQGSLKPGTLVLFRAAGKGAAPTYGEIEKEMLAHFSKLGILN